MKVNAILGALLAFSMTNQPDTFGKGVFVGLPHSGTLPPLEQQPVNAFAFQRKMSRSKRKKLRLKGGSR